MIDTSFLKEMPIFAGLTNEELRSLSEYLVIETADSGEIIIKDGEKGDKMYLLLEGEVEISKRLTLKVSHGDFDERDKQLIRLNADSRAFFGEMALFEDESIRSATVSTTEASKLAAMNKDDFNKLCKSDYKIGYTILSNIIKVLSGRLNKANTDILKLTTAFSIALKGK